MSEDTLKLFESLHKQLALIEEHIGIDWTLIKDMESRITSLEREVRKLRSDA